MLRRRLPGEHARGVCDPEPEPCVYAEESASEETASEETAEECTQERLQSSLEFQLDAIPRPPRPPRLHMIIFDRILINNHLLLYYCNIGMQHYNYKLIL